MHADLRCAPTFS